VVSTQPREGHAPPCNCASNSNDAIRPALLPLLCLQHSRRIEEDGTGAVYSFDPVGSYEREACRAAGAAQSLVQPLLDNQIYFKNQTAAPGLSHPAHLPLPDVLSIVIDSFTSATERHIEVGDGLEMYIVLAKGQALPDVVTNLMPEELPSTEDGERIFVLKRDLKKD